MKIAFFGTVEGSYVALAAICASGHIPYVVATLPPELAHWHADFSNISPLTTRYAIPLHYTTNCNSAGTINVLNKLNPDIILVIGWSQICNAAFLAIPKIGCIGFHPSVLPRLRGRGAISETVLKGERDVGASLYWLGAGANDGPIAAQSRFAVNPDTVTARELYDRSMQALTGLLPQLLSQIEAGDIPAEPQPLNGLSICTRRSAKDYMIDWTLPALEVDRHIRAFGPPYSGASTGSPSGGKLILTAAQKVPVNRKQTGFPGQVQAISERTFTVLCGDGASLLITDWSGDSTLPPLNSILGTSTKTGQHP